MSNSSADQPKLPNPSRRRLFTWLTDRNAAGAVGAEAGRVVREAREAALALMEIGAVTAEAIAAPVPAVPSSAANADLQAELLRLKDAVATLQTENNGSRQSQADILQNQVQISEQLQQLQRMIDERLPQARTETERADLQRLDRRVQGLVKVFVTLAGTALLDELVVDAVYSPLRNWVQEQMQVQTASPLATPDLSRITPVREQRWDGRTLRIGRCPPLEFVQVPAGWHQMKSQRHKKATETSFDYLDGFNIGRTPVTVAQFAEFVATTGYVTRRERKNSDCTWRQPLGASSSVRQKQDHPVVCVSPNDAMAFCRWAEVRLPTEAEWERAAYGTDDRLYPWGKLPPNERLCNFGGHVGDTTPVGSYLAGASPYGALDMAGNVWEWVEVDNHCALRGGSWQSYPEDLSAAARFGFASGSSADYGFRVVCVVPPSP